MFLQNLRAKVGARLNGDSEAGFTLIELLVVMLILGILAAIALPAFFNQKEKAGDAKAKEYAHSAQVAMETYSTDNNGSYAGCDLDRTRTRSSRRSSNARPRRTVKRRRDGHRLQDHRSKAAIASQTFSVVNDEGTLTFPCTAEGNGGCPTGRRLGRVDPWSASLWPSQA